MPGIRNAMSSWDRRKRAAATRPTTIDTTATRSSGSALSSATTRRRTPMGTPVRRSRLNGRLRSLSPAAMFTARLQAAMIRLATMTTSVMSWTIARRRETFGVIASTTTGGPRKGNACSSDVRARSRELDDPSVATTTASTGRLAMLATDRWADGQTVEDTRLVRTLGLRGSSRSPPPSLPARTCRSRESSPARRTRPPRSRSSDRGDGLTWTTVTPAHPRRRAEPRQHRGRDGANVGASTASES